jgi:hypothetical protein
MMQSGDLRKNSARKDGFEVWVNGVEETVQKAAAAAVEDTKRGHDDADTGGNSKKSKLDSKVITTAHCGTLA